MASYNVENDIVGGGYGGFGFGGGGIIAVIAVLLIGWLIFDRKGHHDGGHGGHGHGGFHGCGPATRPYFPDESNFQQSRELDAHMCRVDRDC